METNDEAPPVFTAAVSATVRVSSGGTATFHEPADIDRWPDHAAAPHLTQDRTELAEAARPPS